jgi:hypothetical protein
VNAISIIRRSVFVAVGLVFASAAVSAQTSQSSQIALNVKLGLWEVTSSAQTSGMPDIPDLEKLPPDQRARAEAMLKAMVASAGTPKTIKSCLTREKLQQTLFQEDSRNNCTPTAVTNTSTVYAFKLVCSGQNAASGEWKFEAQSPQAVTGNGTMTLGNRMTSKSTIAAKWIAASCGDVK